MNVSIETIFKRSDLQVIPYDEFIHYALYDDKEGYYRSNPIPFGTKGDFYTSSYVGDVFAKVIVDFFIKVHEHTNIPFQICELGGGSGKFAKQLIESFIQKGITNGTYFFIEGHDDHREKVRSLKIHNWKIITYPSLLEFINEHGPIEGFMFSNEFFDAQPVPVVEMREGKLREIYIRVSEHGSLEEVSLPCREPLVQWIEKYSIRLEEGQRIEVPLYLHTIMKQISSSLTKGIVLTIDYGYTNEEWQDPRRRDGSLRGYYQHEQYSNVLEHVGKMDITHHIHWDPFMEIGEEHELESLILMKQREFLLKTNILQYLSENKSGSYFTNEAKQNRAIQSLISGDIMGEMFDVCIQSKNVNGDKIRSLLK